MPRILSVFAETFPLHSPFRISRGTKTAAEVVTVLISEDGVIGRGEGVPYPRYGESVANAIAVVESVRSAIEGGAGRQDVMQLMPAGSARNAIDCALWDLELQQGDRSFGEAFGVEIPRRPLVTAMTVGLDTAENMARSAATLADAPLLKVKVDRNNPSALLKAVRAAAPASRMIVDPNESWTIDEVRDLQGLMTELRIDLLEQPLPADSDSDLIGFRSAIPVAADEAVHVAADLDQLPDGYGVVNIKLDKSGGLTAALELAAAARQRGLGVMTGCMICSSLSIAPAWAVAAGSDFIDLDGPLWLAEDRSGGVSGASGMLSPPQPGFWGGL
jgi:L-alanine-DL-glutamate epimerase-like enolase superfamily enzyme